MAKRKIAEDEDSLTTKESTIQSCGTTEEASLYGISNSKIDFIEKLLSSFYMTSAPFWFYSSTTVRTPRVQYSHAYHETFYIRQTTQWKIRVPCSNSGCAGHFIDLESFEQNGQAESHHIRDCLVVEKQFRESIHLWVQVERAAIDDVPIYRADLFGHFFVNDMFSARMRKSAWAVACQTTVLTALDILGTYLLEICATRNCAYNSCYLDLWFPHALVAQQQHGYGNIGKSYTVFTNFPDARRLTKTACSEIRARMSLPDPVVFDLMLDASANPAFKTDCQFYVDSQLGLEFPHVLVIHCRDVAVRMLAGIVRVFKNVSAIHARATYVHRHDRDHIIDLVLGVASNQKLRTLNIEPATVAADSDVLSKIRRFFSMFLCDRHALAFFVSFDFAALHRNTARCYSLQIMNKDTATFKNFFALPHFERHVINIIGQFVHGVYLDQAKLELPAGFR
jgi:hypothetical protein